MSDWTFDSTGLAERMADYVQQSDERWAEFERKCAEIDSRKIARIASDGFLEVWLLAPEPNTDMRGSGE